MAEISGTVTREVGTWAHCHKALWFDQTHDVDAGTKTTDGPRAVPSRRGSAESMQSLCSSVVSVGLASAAGLLLACCWPYQKVNILKFKPFCREKSLVNLGEREFGTLAL